MYKLTITNAMAAKARANNANAASSSRTKYSCSATNTPRNRHIHFRPLSLVFFILSSVHSLGNATANFRLAPLRCFTLYLGSTPRLPVRFDTKSGPKRDGTQDTFCVLNECPSTGRQIQNPSKGNSFSDIQG